MISTRGRSSHQSMSGEPQRLPLVFLVWMELAWFRLEWRCATIQGQIGDEITDEFGIQYQGPQMKLGCAWLSKVLSLWRESQDEEGNNTKPKVMGLLGN